MKKLFISLLTFLTLLCAFGLTACGEPEHKHNFVEQTITEENLASSVSCEEKAKYYYTCSCGKIGTETFEDGEALGHAFTDYKSDNNATFTEDGTKTAVCDREGCSKTHTITDEGSKLESYISFKTLNVNDLNVYGKVSNATYEFDFTEEIEVIGIYEYVVSLDFYGANQVLTKKVPLSVGDNVVYVFEMNGKDIVNTYQITIRRRPIHTVEFYYKNTFIESQQVEEDSFAVEPNQPTKAGYTFTGWDFDFNTAITGNRTVNATYTNNKNTAYKVEHYFENLEDNGYTLDSSLTDTLTGETDTLATSTPKDIAHFTYKATSTDSGNINGDGSTVLKVYYTRNRYNVVLNKLDNKGNVSGTGVYANAQEVVATATLNDGYNFLGWYDGEEQVSTSLTYSFNPTKDITLVAKWQANKNTEYKVEHYFENLEDNGYTLDSSLTDTLTGETDTLATATPKDIAHFTYKATSTDSGNIDGDGSTVLKVYYTRNRYTITFNGNGGTLISGKVSQAVKYGGSVKAPTYTKTGYTFTGFDKSLTNISESFTATANWKINQYTLTIVYGNGEKDKTITQDYNSVITETLPSNLERAGYGFYGWDKEMPVTMPAINTTITAKWLAIFNVSSGEITGLTSHGETLSSLVMPESIDGVNITRIGDDAFAGCKSLKSIVIGDSVTSIGSSAFDDCESLTSIEIPHSVTSIGVYAFKGCDSLTSIVIPNSVTSIGACAFYWCYSLTSIVIPDSVTSIGANTFFGCHSLTSIVIPNSVTSIGGAAFEHCNSLTSIVIPNSVTSIDGNAFWDCDSLTSIVIGDSVTSIGGYAFYDCDSLTSIVIPNSVTSIGACAFYDCNSLTSVVIGDSVTSIGSSAFSRCSSLTSIVIPNSVTSISYHAFEDCNSLTIYCEVNEEPSGWNNKWNSGNRPVVWGYKGEN